MNGVARFLTVSAVVLGLSLTQPLRSDAAGNTLSGELVIIDGNPNRFRLVDHPGTFAAPAGVSLDQYDGKPVEVTVGSDGRVTQITEMSMHIEPVIHGYEEVSGHVVLSDPNGSRFTLAGDTRSYVAPAGVDIRPYANHRVKMRLNERGEVTNIALASPEPSTAGDAPPASNCSYGGFSYSTGSPLCQSGTQFVCERGAWRNLGTACSPQ